MKLKTSSWKQKIDPAFDKFIKIYLKFLGKSMLPGNEGYLVPDRNFILENEKRGYPETSE